MIQKSLFNELFMLIEKSKRSVGKDYSSITHLKGIPTKKEYLKCVRTHNQEREERKAIDDKIATVLRKLEGEMK